MNLSSKCSDLKMVASTDPPSAKAFQTKLSVGNSFSLIGAHFLRKAYTTSLLETPPPTLSKPMPPPHFHEMIPRKSTINNNLKSS